MQDFFTRHRLDRICSFMDDNLYISALRRGLSLCIPFFMFGSMALVLLNLPIPAYREFITTALNGRLAEMCFWMFNATMGVLALILIISVSYSFGQAADPGNSGCYPLTCLVSFIIFVVDMEGSVSLAVFNNSWMFTAIVITLLCCSLLRRLLRLSTVWHNKHYKEGIDPDFQNVMSSLAPITVCILVFMLIKLLLVVLLGSIDLPNLGALMFESLFEKIGTGFGGSLIFIFLIHVLWFFGIHGSNMLHMVSDGIFEAGMAENMAAVAAGEAPKFLFTKTFFDNFILLGGSGATLCLLIALMLSSKRSSSRNLVQVSIIPSIFNINELVLFGLPVVFNPIMLIPFLVVPLVLLCTSSAAMAAGLVPYCTEQVQWTTPIFFSGVASTGSWTGAALQLVNLIIGCAIYLPFIRLSEKYHTSLLKKNVTALRDLVIESEETGEVLDLRNPAYQNLHVISKQLTADLYYALNNRKVCLYYQPQFKSDGTLYGVEALLRWNHPTLGFMYPPLVLKLAQQDGQLIKMGYQIIETAACALERLSNEVNYPIDMAVNIMPVQLEENDFCDRVHEILDRHDFHGCTLAFEVTEQIALASTDMMQRRIKCLQDMGIPFHMDDFGMGHSSIIYLQDYEFSAVKLDGSLVKDMLANERSQEIINGIYQMSQSLHFDLIAEYVETQEQKEALDALGCHIYQGYLYSRALSLKDLEFYLQSNKVIDKLYMENHTEKELFL